MEKLTCLNIGKNEFEGYIKKIILDNFNQAAEKIEYLGGGSFGRVFKVTLEDQTCFVLKAYLLYDMHKKEALELTTLSESTTMKYPKVIKVIDRTDDIPFDCMCMEYIKGKCLLMSLSTLFLSKKKKRIIAEQIINSLLETHSKTNDKFGLLENPSCDTWLQYYKPFAIDILETAREEYKKGTLTKKIMDTMEQEWRLWDKIFVQDVYTPSLLHGDINIMNIMYEKPLKVKAFIDPLDSKYGDREYELFQLRSGTGTCFKLYELYKEKYPVSKECDYKNAFYGLWNEVYCFIKTGQIYGFIMNPLLKRMKKVIKELSYK